MLWKNAVIWLQNGDDRPFQGDRMPFGGAFAGEK